MRIDSKLKVTSLIRNALHLSRLRFLNNDGESIALFVDAQRQFSAWNQQVCHEHRFRRYFTNLLPALELVKFFELQLFKVNLFERFLICNFAVFIFVEKYGDQHLQRSLVYQVHGCHACCNLSGLDLVSPLQLTGRFNQSQVQLSREFRFLDKQQKAVVNVFLKQVLESLLLVLLWHNQDWSGINVILALLQFGNRLCCCNSVFFEGVIK